MRPIEEAEYDAMAAKLGRDPLTLEKTITLEGARALESTEGDSTPTQGEIVALRPPETA
jgi:hypothetical protein